MASVIPTPAEIDSIVEKFDARVEKKVEALNRKLRNQPWRRRLVKSVSDILGQCREELTKDSYDYRRRCEKHLEESLKIAKADVSEFRKELPSGINVNVVLENKADLSAKINDILKQVRHAKAPGDELWGFS
ncbi:hypothetical protein ACLB2K_001657 [Fragaria x ananassa]